MPASLFERRGEWRSALLWRVLGLSILQFGVLHAAFVRDWALFSTYQLHWTFAAALALIVGGCRPIALLLAWVLTVASFVGRLGGGAEVQIGEEFGVFLSLPLLGLAGFALWSPPPPPRGLASQEVDELQVALFRVAAVSTLAWATLHKLNVDFFDASVSCGPMLAREITKWWSLPLPDLIVAASPWQIIVSEGLCPVLLLLWPRAGLIWTTLVIGAIGQRGATAFTMLAVGLALSVLERNDAARLRRAARALWPVALVVTGIVVVISFRTYIGPRPWYEFAILQIFLSLVLCAGLWLLAHDVPRVLDAMRPSAVFSRIFPRQPKARALLAGVWLLALLNGLAPYFGWKYRLSFAMLSNLRVDDERWNSLVFPTLLRMTRHDPFVHVERLDMDASAREFFATMPRASTRALTTELVSPMSLEYRMRYVKYHDLAIDMQLTYHGDRMEFADIAHNAEFQRWLDGLPKTLMIQDHLTAGGPQECTH